MVNKLKQYGIRIVILLCIVYIIFKCISRPIIAFFEQPKIVFITAIYGNYEQTCKPFEKQSVPCDFICFTDNKNIKTSSNWIIDTTPYHLLNKSSIDDTSFINSLENNSHTFNIAKYYKQAFTNIPILKKYDCVVWIDGTININNSRTAEYIMNNIYTKKMIGWGHEWRNGILKNEVDASLNDRYTSTFWFGQKQPYQDILKQYNTYIKNGYSEDFWNDMRRENPLIGVWCTCFIAFLQHDSSINHFLQHWYTQTLQFTTQDQIGFSYSLQMCKMIPLTLPNYEIKGESHQQTDFYIKNNHGN